MASQTASMSNGAKAELPRAAIARSVGELGEEIWTLAELQAALFREDCRAAVRKMMWSAIAMGTAVCFAIGALPVLIGGLAEVLARNAGIDHGWALVLVALGTILICGGVIAYCVKHTTHSLAIFERSNEEFRHNIQWLKKIWKPSADRARTNTKDNEHFNGERSM
jgi:hypothetical protein